MKYKRKIFQKKKDKDIDIKKLLIIILKFSLIPFIIYIAKINKTDKTIIKSNKIFISKPKNESINDSINIESINIESIKNSINIESINNSIRTESINNSINNIPDLKVCVCTMGRDENRYIREFVNHYEKYGVDKIYLYDNNLDNGEKFDDIINDYVQKGFVELINWRGKQGQVFQIMNDCYQKTKDYYDWIIFFEIDEFINLYNYTNVKQYLNRSCFKNCEIIHLNIINHSDNDNLYYENKSLIERFPSIVPLKQSQVSVKSIVRGHMDNLRVTWIHWINDKFKGCNGFGGPTDLDHGNDFLYYVIDHYYSKSTEEFINKINRGDIWRNTQDYINHRTEKYLNQNHITLEKIEMLERGIKVNLSKYKERLKKQMARNRNRNRN